MLQDAIERVKGVGEKTATLFHKEGIFTKEDLILGFPISYREYPAPVLIQQARDKEWMAFSGVLKEDFRGNSGNAKGFLFAKVFDQSGEIILQYFHAPYIRKVLKKGMQFVFFGQVREFKGTYFPKQTWKGFHFGIKKRAYGFFISHEISRREKKGGGALPLRNSFFTLCIWRRKKKSIRK